MKDGDIIKAQSDTAVSSVRTLAKTTLKYLTDNKVTLLPRDRFLLGALPALVRYDIAYLNTLEAARLKKIEPAGNENHQKQAGVFIDQMVKAEEELDKVKEKVTHLKRYELLSRFTMLANARALGRFVRIDKPDKVKSQLPELFERLCTLRADSENLLNLGLTLETIDTKLLPESSCESK